MSRAPPLSHRTKVPARQGWNKERQNSNSEQKYKFLVWLYQHNYKYIREKEGIDWKETTKNEFINVKLDLGDSRIQNNKSRFIVF